MPLFRPFWTTAMLSLLPFLPKHSPDYIMSKMWLEKFILALNFLLMFRPLSLLYWLPISYHIQYKTLFTYKALHDYAPGYLTELILTYTPTHVLWSSSSSVLPTPRFRLSFMGGMSFIGHYGIYFHRASKKSPPFPPSKHNSNPIFSLSARTPWL